MNVKKIAAAVSLVAALGMAGVGLGAGTANAQDAAPPQLPGPGVVTHPAAPLPWWLAGGDGPPGPAHAGQAPGHAGEGPSGSSGGT